MTCDTQAKKSRIETEENDHAHLLRQTVDPELWRQLETWCSLLTTEYTLTPRQITKFKWLTLLPHQLPRVDKHRVVGSISNRDLTEEDKEVLALEYPVTPKEIPTL